MTPSARRLSSRRRTCADARYDPELDLAVLAPDGSVAGYGLFWPDLATGVGLVELMRVEDAHAGRGLAAHLLDAELRGLAARGCTRLKVSVEPANTPAVRLYTGAGFVVSRLDRTWLYVKSASYPALTRTILPRTIRFEAFRERALLHQWSTPHQSPTTRSTSVPTTASALRPPGDRPKNDRERWYPVSAFSTTAASA